MLAQLKRPSNQSVQEIANVIYSLHYSFEKLTKLNKNVTTTNKSGPILLVLGPYPGSAILALKPVFKLASAAAFPFPVSAGTFVEMGRLSGLVEAA